MDSAQDLLQQATDFHQYDNLHWEVSGAQDDPRRQWFRSVIAEHIPELTEKRVLDIGSGVGQLFPFVLQRGAAEVVGVEPSERNTTLSKQLHPDVVVHQTTLQDAQLDQWFDIAVAILVFEHIHDLAEAFQKVNTLLAPNGIFALMTLDKEYAETQRFGYTMEVEKLNDASSVVCTERSDGQLCDIVRTSQMYIDAAQKSGFCLQEDVPMIPRQSFLEACPKYLPFADTVMHHLYIFQKL